MCLAAFQAQLSASGITPGHPLFLSRLLGFLHDCFQTAALDALAQEYAEGQLGELTVRWTGPEGGDVAAVGAEFDEQPDEEVADEPTR